MRRVWTRLVYVALIAAVIACAFNSYQTLRNIGDEARAAQAAYRENLVWFATQLTHEVDTLLHVLDDFVRGAGATRDDLQERFDVVWSRFAGFEETQAGQRLLRLESAPAVVSRARRALEELDPVVASLAPDGLGAEQVRGRMRALSRELHGLALAAMHESNLRLTADADRGHAMRTRIMLLLASMLVSGALVVVLLLMERAKVASLKEGLEETVATRTRALTHEVAERREAELELERYRDRLEEQVRERTADLRAAQADLVLSERLAAIGNVTGTVSHELRTPLGTIHNSYVVLRHHLADAVDPVASNLQRIERNVARCNRIIEDLLAYAETSSPAPVRLEVAPWLDTLLGDIEARDGVTVTRELNGESIVNADPSRLAQALTSLVRNASQAVAEAGREPGEIAVRLSRAQGRAEIRIHDNGAGIDPAIGDRVFEPLFSTRTFGVGLGLALVHRVMEHHAGGALVEDTGEEGTTMLVWLPEAASRQKKAGAGSPGK